jgi:hypothetical protein
MVGALTFKGVHHAFQGCPNSGSWSHSTSTDLVHWKDLGVGMRALHETYEGMDSDSVPCAGFITVDDAGTPCAGFRQCSSGKGTTGLNPHAKSWDVPTDLVDVVGVVILIKELAFGSRGKIAEAASFALVLQVVVVMRSLVLGHLLGLEHTLAIDDAGGAPSMSST